MPLADHPRLSEAHRLLIEAAFVLSNEQDHAPGNWRIRMAEESAQQAANQIILAVRHEDMGVTA